MPKKKPKPAGECCEAMIAVLAEEKPQGRTGMHVPLMLWTKDPAHPRIPHVCYTPSGHHARTFVHQERL